MTGRSRRRVHIIGVPLDLGAGRRGVDMGPSALRIAGLGPAITGLGYDVGDHGDLAAPTRETTEVGDVTKRYVADIAAICRRVYAVTLEAHDDNGIPVVLGGDHSLSAGSVAASAEAVLRRTGKPLGLIWIDAHGDMNSPATTLSGNVHGMPLAALLGGEPAELSAIGPNPAVAAENTVIIGARDLDELEKDQIRRSGVKVFTMSDIDRAGIASVADRAIAIASHGTGGVHVSLDLDACDPSIVPGVGTPVRGGLTYREAHMIMELIAEAGCLVALDLVEVNPTLDVGNTTAQLSVELALSALGKRIL
ncbi:MAG: arginase [Hyphomicrobiaceae bacterium]|nr:arginase [Hyphomicrobiaceae bacterium]